MKRKPVGRRRAARKAISIALTAAMLATTGVPVWAEGLPVIEEVADGEVTVEETGVDLLGENKAAISLAVGDEQIADGAFIEWGSEIAASLTGSASEGISWTAAQGGAEAELAGSPAQGKYTPLAADVGKEITCTIKYGTDKTIEKGFTVKNIQPKPEDTTYQIEDTGLIYDGQEKRPAVTDVKAKNQFGTEVSIEESAYEVAYRNAVNAGKSTEGAGPKAVVTFKESEGFAGTLIAGFTIAPIELESAATTVTIDTESDRKVTFSQDAEDYQQVLRSAVTKVTVNGKDISVSDYDISLEGENKAAARPIVIVGKGNYQGSVTVTDKTVQVERRNLSSFALLKAIPNQPYKEGAAVTIADPGEKVQIADTTKVDGKNYILQYGDNDSIGDFKLTYKNNHTVGSASVTITGINNYTGTMEKTFQIVSGDIKTDLEQLIKESLRGKDLTYTGKPIDPVDQVYGTDTQFQLNRDFKYSLSGNTNVSTEKNKAKITVTGIKNYAGKSFTVEFSIVPKNVGEFSASNIKIGDTVYDSSVTDEATAAKKYLPKVEIKYNGMTLRKGTDYDLDYGYDNIGKPGINSNPRVNVTITGKGNFIGTNEAFTSKIIGKSIAGFSKPSIPTQYFTGYEITPEITLKDGSRVMVKGTDYTVKYEDNTEIGKASVTITGINAYSGQMVLSFQIQAKKSNGYYVVKTDAKGITSSDQKLPSVVYDQAKAESPAGITSTAFKVVDKDGKPVPSSDYLVTFSSNKKAGQNAVILITGINGKDISASGNFWIAPAKLPAGSVTGVAQMVYTGSPIKIQGVKYEAQAPGAAKPVEEGVDYKVSYQNNTNVGTATILIAGMGNYADAAGNVTVHFDIARADILKNYVTISKSVPYAGGQETSADITVTNPNGGMRLTAGTDYTVSYKNNKEIGTASAELALTTEGQKKYRFVGTDTSNYKSMSLQYVITAFDFKDAVVAEIPQQNYTGKEIMPEIAVKAGNTALRNGKDYVVEFKDNTEPGVATAVIKPAEGVKGYTGSKTVTFKIVKAEVQKPDTPVIKVNSSTTAIKVSWDAVKDATGYVVYGFNKADRKTIVDRKAVSAAKTSYTFKFSKGTVKTFVVRAYKKVAGKNVYSAISNSVTSAIKPDAAKIKSAIQLKNGKVRVTLTGVPKGAKDYAYCVSTDGGKTYTISAKGPLMPYNMWRGIKKGKVNYIKVRSYIRDHNGKSVYGAWSNIVKVSVK